MAAQEEVFDDFGFLDEEQDGNGTENFGFGFGDESSAGVAVPAAAAAAAADPVVFAPASPGGESDGGTLGYEPRFESFAAVNFVEADKISPRYQRTPIPHALLASVQSEQAVRAARAMHSIILKFMGDMPETDESKKTVAAVPETGGTLMRRLSRTLSKSFMKRVDTTPDVTETKEKAPEAVVGPTKVLPNLEKARFLQQCVTRMAPLRDELFCQLIKQLSKNPSKTSHARGWILLALMVGLQAPDHPDLYLALKLFVSSCCPPSFRGYILQRLERTHQKGNRSDGPSWLEMQAVKERKYWQIPVMFGDQDRLIVDTDSSSTAEEFCAQLAVYKKIADPFGFSLYLSVNGHTYCLCAADRIMDSISQCEQLVKQKGLRERDAEWVFFYTREYFPPKFKPLADPAGTNLVYKEIVGKIATGLLDIAMEDVLVSVMAQQLYVEKGAQVDDAIISQFVEERTPPAFKSSKAMASLRTQIEREHATAAYTKNAVNPMTVKAELVVFASNEWSSRFSRLYPINFTKGLNGAGAIAINSQSILFLDSDGQVQEQLDYKSMDNLRFVEPNFIQFSINGVLHEATTLKAKDFVQTVLAFIKRA